MIPAMPSATAVASSTLLFDRNQPFAGDRARSASVPSRATPRPSPKAYTRFALLRARDRLGAGHVGQRRMAAVEAAAADGEVERIQRDREHLDQLALAGLRLGTSAAPEPAEVQDLRGAHQTSAASAPSSVSCTCEVPVEPRDLERAPRLDSRCHEQEGAPVRKPRPRLDEHPEAGRVDKRHLGKDDDKPLGRTARRSEQRLSRKVCVVEVELAGKVDDDRVAALLDRGNRRLVEPAGLVHAAAHRRSSSGEPPDTGHPAIQPPAGRPAQTASVAFDQTLFRA
jgi:hypothetical protein